MTDDEVYTALTDWLTTVCGVTVIRTHQGGDAPALPYVAVNMPTIREVFQHERETVYFDTGVPNSEGENQIRASPIIETEWFFSVFAYGANPTDVLRPIKSAAKLPQMNEPLMPALSLHDISQVRYLPELINKEWEPRAQVDIFLRGLTKDGFIVDVIDEPHFNFEQVTL